MVLETNILSLLVIVAIMLATSALAWLVAFEIRLRKLFRGRKAKDLESVMQDIQKELNEFSVKRVDIDTTLENVERRLQKGARHMGLVRFNPYADAGSNQSFAIAILDELKNGFVISSLYGRDSNRMYAKPIIQGVSQYQLSTEENQAIEKALQHKI